MDIKSPVGEGRKLKVTQQWNSNYSTSPVIGSAITVSSLNQTKTTEYAGNMIYENGALKRILIDGGYIEGGVYYYYLRDHLGNNRVVANASGTVIQRTHYYPFGMAFAETSSTEQGLQPYKYNDKELDRMHGLNLYDYEARYMEPALGRFTTMDPLAEKYYGMTPYGYCGGNPMNAIDPDGRSTWVINNGDGTYRVVGGDLEDKDKNIYVWSIQDSNFVCGESIGESDLISSFYNSDVKSWSIGSVINPSDNSGIDFFNSFNNDEPAISDYMANATGGGKYDFKRAGTTINGTNDNSVYYYRGMPIRTENGKTIYSSARDIGNYTAGYIAGHLQIRWDLARKQFDKLESQQKGYPAVEGYSTQNAELQGWNAGLKSSFNNIWKTLRWTIKSIPGGINWLLK